MGTHIFNTPYDKGDPFNGKQCTIQRTKTVTTSEGTDTLLVLLFDHGPYVEAWPEEIQPVDETDPNQCPEFVENGSCIHSDHTK